MQYVDKFRECGHANGSHCGFDQTGRQVATTTTLNKVSAIYFLDVKSK